MAFNKDAAAFMPRWLQQSAPAAPAAAPAAPAAAKRTATPPPAASPPPRVPASPAREDASKAKESNKLSPDAPVFLPRGPALATTQSAAAKPETAPAAPAGQWAKGRPTQQQPPAVPPSPPPKSAEAATPLNAAAVVYVPRSLSQSLARVADTPPMKPAAAGTAVARTSTPPPEKNGAVAATTSNDKPGRMALTDTWCLFFVDRSPQDTTEYDPVLVYKIDSIETFWRTFNNIPTITNCSIGSTYYFFRDGIKPKWEDPKNINGGAWSIRFNTSKDDQDLIDAVWERLCCRVVGNSWLPEFRPIVNGLVAKIRERQITLQVWVTERIDLFPTDIVSAVGDVFPAFKTDYYDHQNMYSAAAARDKERKPSKKRR